MRTTNNTGRESAFTLLVLTSTALVGLALAPAAQAQEWQGDSSSDWSGPANWDLAHVPAAADDVTIDNVAGGDARIVGEGKDAVAHDIPVSKTATANSRAFYINAAATGLPPGR